MSKARIYKLYAELGKQSSFFDDKGASSAAGLVRSTQFPEIGEKEWTYNRMLETSLRDRGVTGRVVSLHLKALPEGVHVIKYLPLTPLYAEETMFQVSLNGHT